MSAKSCMPLHSRRRLNYAARLNRIPGTRQMFGRAQWSPATMPVATMHSSCLHSLSLDHPEIVYWLANRWQASVSYQQRLVFAALSPQGTVLSSESALPPPLRNTLYNRPYVASYTIPSLPPYRSEESKRPPSAATDLVRLASAAHISPRCSLEAGDVLRRPARSHAQAAQWTPPQQQSSRGESIRPRMPFMVLSRDEYHVPSVTRIYRVCLFHFPPPPPTLAFVLPCWRLRCPPCKASLCA